MGFYLFRRNRPCNKIDKWESAALSWYLSGLHYVLKGGGGIRKMFYSEKPKDLLWSIGSSYWLFNLGVHVGVMEKQIMAKNGPFWPFVTIFSNRRSSALFELNTDWTRLNIVSHLWGVQLDPFGTMENGPWGSQGASKTAISGHMWKYLAIGGPRCPICVEHLLNKVEHCILQMKGPVAPLWTHQKWFRRVSGGPQNGHFWPYLAILDHRRPWLSYLGWTPVEQGWTLFPTSEGASWTTLEPSKMVPGGRKAPKSAIFGHRH